MRFTTLLATITIISSAFAFPTGSSQGRTKEDDDAKEQTPATNSNGNNLLRDGAIMVGTTALGVLSHKHIRPHLDKVTKGFMNRGKGKGLAVQVPETFETVRSPDGKWHQVTTKQKRDLMTCLMTVTGRYESAQEIWEACMDYARNLRAWEDTIFAKQPVSRPRVQVQEVQDNTGENNPDHDNNKNSKQQFSQMVVDKAKTFGQDAKKNFLKFSGVVSSVAAKNNNNNGGYVATPPGGSLAAPRMLQIVPPR